MSKKTLFYHKLVFIEDTFQVKVSEEIYELIIDSKDIEKLDNYSLPVSTIKNKVLMLRRLFLKNGEVLYIESMV